MFREISGKTGVCVFRETGVCVQGNFRESRVCVFRLFNRLAEQFVQKNY